MSLGLSLTFAGKNARLLVRSPRTAAALLLLPPLVCLFLSYMGSLFEERLRHSAIPSPKVEPVARVPRCSGPKDCVSVGYFVAGEAEEWTEAVMRLVAEDNGLAFGTDVRLLGVGTPADFSDHVAAHRNRTQIAVIFCTGVWGLRFGGVGVDVPCRFDRLADKRLVFYSLFYNMTLGFEVPYLVKAGATFPTNQLAVALKRSLDQSITRHFGAPDFHFDLQTASFPSPENRHMKEYDVVSNFGSLALFLPFLLVYLFAASEMVSEKARGLKLHLRLAGLTTPVHVASWALLYTLAALYCAVATYASGRLCGFAMFANVPATFWLFFLAASAFATASLASLVAALAPAGKSGFLAAHLVLMAGLVFQLFLGNPGAVAVLYHPRPAFRALRALLEFYPGFNYSKVFADLVHFAGSTFSAQKGMFVSGDGFGWHNLWDSYGSAGMPEVGQLPSVGESLQLLFRNTVLIYLLTVAVEAAGESRAARFGTKAASKAPRDSLVVEGLSVSYGWLSWLGRGKRALDGVNFAVRQGELVTVLGENGAGKSTLIQALLGCRRAVEGRVSVLGVDVGGRPEETRKMVSLCPQSDVYWDELTPVEHLRYFGLLRGLSDGFVLRRRIEELLAAIELSDKANEPVKALSGGMRRRLAIGLAVVHEPPVIVFDEPTVGLDPIKRDKVVRLVKGLKSGRIVVLTTHSMEEAELLSDRVVFLKAGQVRAVGTPFELKDAFADTVSLSVLLRCKEGLSELKKRLSFAWRLKSAFGSRVELEVPKELFSAALRALEGSGALVEDWGFATGTLENAFERLNGGAMAGPESGFEAQWH